MGKKFRVCRYDGKYYIEYRVLGFWCKWGYETQEVRFFETADRAEAAYRSTFPKKQPSEIISEHKA